MGEGAYILLRRCDVWVGGGVARGGCKRERADGVGVGGYGDVERGFARREDVGLFI